MHIPAPLLIRWADPKVHPLPPLPESSVLEAFAKMGLRVPRDVVSLYGQIGGMGVDAGDHWRLWSLDEVLQEHALAPSCPIAFSDYMIDCWRFHLLPTDEDVCRVLSNYGDGPLREISPSLELFIGSLATSPRKILDPPELSRSGSPAGSDVGGSRRFSRGIVAIRNLFGGSGRGAR